MSFPRKGNATVLLANATTTGTGTDLDNSGDGVLLWHSNRTYQAWGACSDSGTAVIAINVRNHDEAPWLNIATITLTLGPSATTDGFASSAGWKYTQANITAISGTAATVSVWTNSVPL